MSRFRVGKVGSGCGRVSGDVGGGAGSGVEMRKIGRGVRMMDFNGADG